MLTLALLLVAADPTPSVTWAVLPVRGESPPPGDPTLLRLTRTLGEAIQEATEADVKVVKRELRDDACPSADGICPRDLAVLVTADRAVSLVLAPDYSGVTVRIYSGRKGLESEGKIGCKWVEGSVECETEKLAEMVSSKAVAAPMDRAAVEQAWAKLDRRLQGCRKLGWGEVEKEHRAAEPGVRFRVGERGKAEDVRLEPDAITASPAYACMARIVESLRVAPGPKGASESFRFTLPRLN